MNYKIFTISVFDKAAKRLSRKHRSIKVDLKRLVAELQDNPFAGVAIPGYGHRVWKIRLASIDMQTGKRGGYRVIYALDQSQKACYLLYIYSKPEKSDVTAREIEKMLQALDAFLFDEK